jgi:hypothetical protein
MVLVLTLLLIAALARASDAVLVNRSNWAPPTNLRNEGPFTSALSVRGY